MRLSTKGQHAVTAMLDLALHDREGPVTLADISQNQGISLSYLEQLFARLRKRGLVEGVRGPGGGYRLARPGREITFAAIITAVDDKAEVPARPDAGAGDDRPVTQELWTALSRQIYEFLNGMSLAEFLERPGARRVLEREGVEHPGELHRRSAA